MYIDVIDVVLLFGMKLELHSGIRSPRFSD